MKKVLFAVGLIVLAVISTSLIISLRGDGSSDVGGNMSDSSQTPSEPEEPGTVIIDDLGFQQPVLTVKKGDTVTWKNLDTARHNVVFDEPARGSVENGKLISQGEALRFTFSEAGEFPYHCEPHPFMKAKIVVTE